MATLFEYAGGEEALHRLEQTFYSSVLADPLLQPLFGAGNPEHVDHLTAFTAESFGGREHVEFGSQVAMQNSHATTDDELHPLREVPRWTWPGDEAAASRARDSPGISVFGFSARS